MEICKNYKFVNNKGYIKENINCIMNLKDRGITVGDLLIILIVIVTTTILFKTFNKDKKTTNNFITQEKISHNNILLSDRHLNKFLF